MPKVSEEHREARREQILAGARTAFSRYGYEGATVARLEEATGLSRGAIFNYFPDKWSLFKALAERDQHRFLDLLVEHGLDAVLQSLAEESPDWLGVYFELTRRLRTNPELLEEFQHRSPPELEQAADETLTRLRSEGRVRDDVSFETLNAFINVVANGLALGRSLGMRVDLEEFLTLVHRGIDAE